MTQTELTQKWRAIQKATNSADRCRFIKELGWFMFLGLSQNRLLDVHVDSRSSKVHFLIRIDFAVGEHLDVLILREFTCGSRTFVWGIETNWASSDPSPIRSAMSRIYEDDDHPEGTKWNAGESGIHVDTMYQGDTQVLMIAC